MKRLRSFVFLIAIASLITGVHRDACAAFSNPTFTAPTDSVQGGQTILVPITVTSFSDVAGFSFTLNWSASLLTYQSATFLGQTGVQGVGALSSGQVSAGKLGFVWDDNGSPLTLTDGSAVLTITFRADPVNTGSSPITFADDPVARDVTSPDSLSHGFLSTPGSIEVVPEPANVALGIFGVFGVAVVSIRQLRKPRAAA